MRFAVALSPRSAAVLFLAAGLAHAEPNWTKTGDCAACHSTTLTGVVDVYGHNGMSDPDGSGPKGLLKVFRLQRNQPKSLMVRLDGLHSADRYAVALTQVRDLGLGGGTLSYYADCGWSQWWGTFFTDPTFSYRWNAGPREFSFDLQPTADASYDSYELVFAVAGINDDTDQLFYSEDHFLVQVLPEGPAPPRVVSAVSGRPHGPSGEFDVDLMPAAGQLAFEGREGGPKSIVVTFSEPIQAATSSPADVVVAGPDGPLSVVTGVGVNGARLFISLDGVADASLLTLAFPGITSVQGSSMLETICFGVLAGDVGGDGWVNLSDMLTTRDHLNEKTDAENYRADINADGVLDLSDLLLVRNSLNRNAGGACW